MSNVTVRDFALTDHEAVFAVARAAWSVAYADRYEPEELEQVLEDWYSLNNHTGMLAAVQAGQLYFKVAEEEGRVIGYVAGDLVTGRLHRLYLHPEHFRRGRGTHLLNGFINALVERSVSVCEVTCDRLNPIGLGFYRKHGFALVGEDGEDGEEYRLARETGTE